MPTWNNLFCAVSETMNPRHYPKSPLLAACTAIWRGDKLLLAKRSRAPNPDTWAMPGGVVEVGETLEEAARREVQEETGLILNKIVFNRNHEIIRKDAEGLIEMHYVLAMFVAQSLSGKAVAGDDAADVGWFRLEELDSLPLTAHTKRFAEESLLLLPKLT